MVLTPLDELFRADLAKLARAARIGGKQLDRATVVKIVARIQDAYHEVTFTFSRGED